MAETCICLEKGRKSTKVESVCLHSSFMVMMKNLSRCQYGVRCSGELFSMCAFLSVVKKAWACCVDKVLSSATTGIAAEAVSAVQ